MLHLLHVFLPLTFSFLYLLSRWADLCQVEQQTTRCSMFLRLLLPNKLGYFTCLV